MFHFESPAFPLKLGGENNLLIACARESVRVCVCVCVLSCLLLCDPLFNIVCVAASIGCSNMLHFFFSRGWQTHMYTMHRNLVMCREGRATVSFLAWVREEMDINVIWHCGSWRSSHYASNWSCTLAIRDIPLAKLIARMTCNPGVWVWSLPRPSALCHNLHRNKVFH